MIEVFVPNLKNRKDRRDSIKLSFENENMFRLHILEAIPHPTGAISLWKTLQSVVNIQKNHEDHFFIFCEDDHMFTKDYSFEFFNHAIQEAQHLDADILSGGVSWFQTGIQISKNLFWVESFSGLQFTVIFRKFYQKVLDVNDFGEHDAADLKISALTDKKFVMYPFISIQKEFGYSDVTAKNNEGGRVERLFNDTSGRLQLLKNVRQFYLPDFQK